MGGRNRVENRTDGIVRPSGEADLQVNPQVVRLGRDGERKLQ